MINVHKHLNSAIRFCHPTQGKLTVKKAIQLMCVSSLLLSGCVAHVKEDALIKSTPGTRLSVETTPDSKWSIKVHDLARGDGAVLQAALFTRSNAVGLVVYFGGNRFTISNNYQSILDVYQNHPVDVLIVDHRGYGGSTGTPSFKALSSDALAAYDYARSLPGYSQLPVIVHGQSLGSFLAGKVAEGRKIDGLVLESSATTAEDWVQGFVDNNMLVRKGVVGGELKGVGNLSVVRELDEPVLIVVGKDDTTTRPAMSQSLYDAAKIDPSLKELLIVPARGHNNAVQSQEYSSAFSRLLSKARGGRT